MGLLLAPLAVLLHTLGPAQVAWLDTSREPWRAVMATIQRDGEGAAQRPLEQVGRDPALRPWERAHALRWAGRIAWRARRLDEAGRDFAGAYAAAPESFDGGMAALHRGEIAIDARRWRDAERALAVIEHHPDPIVQGYARHWLTAVRERVRRLAGRYVALAVVLAGLLALAVRVARRARTPGVWRAFSRVLVAGEAVALAGLYVVPRVTAGMGAVGWVAFAAPAAVAGALFVATRARPAPRPGWREVAVALAVGCVLAAGLYLAFDYTWWATERPIVGA